jgi:hypothetical protein
MNLSQPQLSCGVLSGRAVSATMQACDPDLPPSRALPRKVDGSTMAGAA